MGTDERKQQVFIVRIWQEPGEAERAGRWRGSVEEAPGTPRIYFDNLAELSDFFVLRVGITDAPATESSSRKPH